MHNKKQKNSYQRYFLELENSNLRKELAQKDLQHKAMRLALERTKHLLIQQSLPVAYYLEQPEVLLEEHELRQLLVQ